MKIPCQGERNASGGLYSGAPQVAAPLDAALLRGVTSASCDTSHLAPCHSGAVSHWDRNR